MKGDKHATVLGNGIVGLTTAQILRRGGWQVNLVKSSTRTTRPIALQEPTWHLLNDIWDCDISKQCRSMEIVGRRTCWSKGEYPQINSISGLSLDSAALAEALENRFTAKNLVDSSDGTLEANGDEEPVFDARGFHATHAAGLTFGDRVMYVWTNLASHGAKNNQMEIFAGNGFWLFALPNDAGCTSVQLALPSGKFDYSGILMDLLNQPEAKNSQISDLRHVIEQCLKLPPFKVSIAPSINLSPSSGRKYSVGENVMKYDPICGDGTGQGIKSAILAIAAENSSSRLDSFSAAEHISNRHVGTFCAHLQQCAEYYQSIHSPINWREDLLQSQNGIRILNSKKVKTKKSLTLSLNPPPNIPRWTHGPHLTEN